MGINKIQFQKGLSMAEFIEHYGTEEKCQAALVDSRWPSGFICPKCGDTRHSTFERKGLHYWQCSTCREQTTAICGTIFHATKLPLTRWFLAMHLLSQSKNSVSALELKRHLGVRYKTAWLMKHKLMQVMSEREDSRQLDGRVEIDDAYLGGELPGGKSGRGSENKISFIAAVQTTDTGHPLFACLTRLDFTKDAMTEWAKKSLSASSHVVSDGLWCFRSVTASGATHDRTVTGGGAASVKLEKFRAVNTLLSNLKTAFSGTYHAFNFSKYAHRYLAEVQLSIQPPLRLIGHSAQTASRISRYFAASRASHSRGCTLWLIRNFFACFRDELSNQCMEGLVTDSPGNSGKLFPSGNRDRPSKICTHAGTSTITFPCALSMPASAKTINQP